MTVHFRFFTPIHNVAEVPWWSFSLRIVSSMNLRLPILRLELARLRFGRIRRLRFRLRFRYLLRLLLGIVFFAPLFSSALNLLDRLSQVQNDRNILLQGAFLRIQCGFFLVLNLFRPTMAPLAPEAVTTGLSGSESM